MTPADAAARADRDAAATLARLRSNWPPPTHSFAGANSDRQSVGDPGHCEDCAILGHVTAHPNLGCGDVECTGAHAPGDEIDLELDLLTRSVMVLDRVPLSTDINLLRRLLADTERDIYLESVAALGYDPMSERSQAAEKDER